jgi:hypothetical protein
LDFCCDLAILLQTDLFFSGFLVVTWLQKTQLMAESADQETCCKLVKLKELKASVAYVCMNEDNGMEI